MTSPFFGIVPTDSEDEHHGAMVVHGDLSDLPRSVRWRIQLGLLQDPTTVSCDEITASRCTLQDVTELNRQIILNQGERFKNLVEKHVEEQQDGDGDKHNGDESSNNNHHETDKIESNGTVDVDPLTAMVMEQEARENRKAELYLKYRKERARRKRGLSTEARIIDSESDEVDRSSVSMVYAMMIIEC
jgi:hypothetical protein